MHRVLPGLELCPAVWAAIPTTRSTAQSRPFFCFRFPVLASPPSAGLKSPQQVHLHQPTLRRQKPPPHPSPPSLNDFPSSAGTDLCPGVLMGFRCFRSPAQEAALPRGLPGAVLWGRGRCQRCRNARPAPAATARGASQGKRESRGRELGHRPHPNTFPGLSHRALINLYEG